MGVKDLARELEAQRLATEAARDFDQRKREEQAGAVEQQKAAWLRVINGVLIAVAAELKQAAPRDFSYKPVFASDAIIGLEIKFETTQERFYLAFEDNGLAAKSINLAGQMTINHGIVEPKDLTREKAIDLLKKLSTYKLGATIPHD